MKYSSAIDRHECLMWLYRIDIKQQYMKLFFRESGQGRPLIILHGLFGSSDNWFSHAKTFAPFFKVYLVDQRNHGQSKYHNLSNFITYQTNLLNLSNIYNLSNICQFLFKLFKLYKLFKLLYFKNHFILLYHQIQTQFQHKPIGCFRAVINVNDSNVRAIIF